MTSEKPNPFREKPHFDQALASASNQMQKRFAPQQPTNNKRPKKKPYAYATTLLMSFTHEKQDISMKTEREARGAER
jgi:hypothetical protein